MRRHEMKRIRAVALLAILAVLAAANAIALENSSTTNMQITLQQVFGLEFYTDANVLYSNVITFSAVDPTKAIVYPDGRKDSDGKSDAAVICRSNAGTPWFLKVSVKTSAPLTADRIKFYLDQPYNRNTGERSDGALTQSPKWYGMSETPTTVYTSGYKDQSNLPFGTLAAFNYAVDPTGLEAGKSFTAVITYTMTTAS